MAAESFAYAIALQAGLRARAETAASVLAAYCMDLEYADEARLCARQVRAKGAALRELFSPHKTAHALHAVRASRQPQSERRGRPQQTAVRGKALPTALAQAGPIPAHGLRDGRKRQSRSAKRDTLQGATRALEVRRR